VNPGIVVRVRALRCTNRTAHGGGRPGEGQEEVSMGKALLGTHATPGSLRLLDEVRALRARVAELERALADAEAARDARRDADAVLSDTEVVRVDDREPART
jgi:hypothetical protein